MNKTKVFGICATIFMLVMSSVLINISALQAIKPSLSKKDLTLSNIKLETQETFVKVDFIPKDESSLSMKKFLDGNNKIDDALIYHSVSFDGYVDHEPPWADSYAWAEPPEGANTYMNKETGVGKIYPAQIPNLLTRAGAGIKDQYYVYTASNSQGAIILKNPSWVSMGIYPAGICQVGIGIDEYDPDTGDITNSWSTVVVAGDYRGYLDDVGVECEFRQNYIYGVTCGGLVIRDDDAVGSIEELRVKKIRWIWIEDDYDIDLNEPEKGSIYLWGRNIFTNPSLSLAILLYCPGIQCEAVISGAVDHIIFECDGNTVTVDNPTSGNIWSAKLYSVQGFFETLYVYAYDSNDNEVASDSIRVLKLGGS